MKIVIEISLDYCTQRGFINFLVIVRHTVPSVNKYIFPIDIILLFLYLTPSVVFLRETILLVAYS